MIQVAKDAFIVRPFEDLLSVANFGEEVMAQFANYTQAMKKADLTDKLIQPLFSARTIQDLQTTSALLDLARKMVKISWKGQGDPLQVPYIDYLSGSGVSEGTSTEGSEEKLSVTMKSVALAEKAHSTAWTRHAGRLARYSVLEASREALKDWAVRKIEADIRTSLQTSITQIIRPNDKGSDEAMTATDVLDTETIRQARWILWKKRAASFSPKDVDTEGKMKKSMGTYVLICPGELLKDLEDDTDFKNAQEKAADLARGFSPWEGDIYLYKGVLIVKGDPRIWTTETISAGYSYKMARALMLGSDAFVLGLGQPEGENFLTVTPEESDGGRLQRLVLSIIYGVGVIRATSGVWIHAATQDLI